MRDIVPVAAAVILRRDGQVLLAQRPLGLQDCLLIDRIDHLQGGNL